MTTDAADPTTQIDVVPMAGALGASITGIDLGKPLDDATFATLEQLFLTYLVLAFREQDITPEAHLAFAGRWGTVIPHPYVPSIEGYPGIMRVYDPTPLTQLWHSDFSYARRPRNSRSWWPARFLRSAATPCSPTSTPPTTPFRKG